MSHMQSHMCIMPCSANCNICIILYTAVNALALIADLIWQEGLESQLYVRGLDFNYLALLEGRAIEPSSLSVSKQHLRQR